MSEMTQDVKIEHTSRQIIENVLLTALTERAQVAILADESDLNTIIDGLLKLGSEKAVEMATDFQKLKKAAFHTDHTDTPSPQ